MNVSLTPKLEGYVRAKVKTGNYNNASEVIREALRLLQQEDDAMAQAKLSRLRKAIQAGVASPDVDNFDIRTALKRLKGGRRGA